MTYQQFIDQACEQVLRDAPELAEGDIEIRAEALAPAAIHHLAERIAGDPDKRHLLLREVTIALTNGVGTLPATVLTGFLQNATLVNPDSLSDFYAFVPYWEDYRSTSERRMGYFTNRASTLDVTAPFNEYSESTGRTGNIKLSTSTVPPTPTLATDSIADLPFELEDDLVMGLAEMIRAGVSEMLEK